MTHKIKELDESMTYGRRSINRFVAAPRVLVMSHIVDTAPGMRTPLQ